MKVVCSPPWVWPRGVIAILLLFAACRVGFAIDLIKAELQILPPAANGWIRLSACGFGGHTLVTVQASSNLVHWQTIATTHDWLLNYPHTTSQDYRLRFYRVFVTPRHATNDW